MGRYIVDGQAYVFPDNFTDEYVVEILRQQGIIKPTSGPQVLDLLQQRGLVGPLPEPYVSPKPGPPPGMPGPGEPGFRPASSRFIGMSTADIDLGESPGEDIQFAPGTGTVPLFNVQLEERAPREPVFPSFTEYPEAEVAFQEGAPVTGRQFDLPTETFSLRDRLANLRKEKELEYIREGFSISEAADKADADVSAVLQRRVDVEGQPTSRGVGGLGEYLPVPPFFRESRIDFRQPELTIEGRKPSDYELMRESLARQVVMTPEEALERRKVRSVERELAAQEIPEVLMYRPEYEDEVRREIAERADSFFEDILTDIDPGTGAVLETPLTAVLRSTGLVSTLVNEAVLGLPLFYDTDDQGRPVDENQFAYKAHKFLVDAAEATGVDRAAAEKALTGTVGPTAIPVPFSGMNRQKATPIDPTAVRGASETETYLGDVAVSLAKGRFLGDELYSIDGYTEDLVDYSIQNNEQGTWPYMEETALTTAARYAPIAFGAGLEMVYGVGPLSAAAKVARGTGKGVATTSRFVGAANAVAAQAGKVPSAKLVGLIDDAARVGELAGEAIQHPVEMSKRVRHLRIVQDLMDGMPDKPDIDLLTDISTAQRAVSDAIAKDVMTPYTMVQAVQSGAIDTVGDLRRIAGDSTSGRAFLADMGIAAQPDNAPFVRVPEMQEALQRFRYRVHKPEIDAIIGKTDIPDEVKAARIFALLADPFALGTPKYGPQAKPYYDSILISEQLSGRARPNAPLVALARKAMGEESVKDLGFADIFSQYGDVDVLPYMPVRAGAPIYKSMHEFGETLADSGRRVVEAVEVPGELPRGTVQQRIFRGPFAGSYLRRVGGTVPTPADIKRAPEVYREAAIGAASRGVQATLENVIPSDLVFVTSTLMTPRQKLSRADIASVGEEMRQYERRPIIGPPVDGKRVVLYQWELAPDKAIEALGGAEAVRRSTLKQSIVGALSRGEALAPAQHQALEDALLTQAYRRVLGDRAMEAVFAGRQTEQARVPSASLGLFETALETTGEVAPRQSRALAEAREPSFLSLPFQAGAIGRNLVGSATVKAGKQFKSDKLIEFGKELDRVAFSQTPVGLETALRTAENTISSIPDNFQREVRDAAARIPNPEIAFNTVLNRRTARDLKAARESLTTQVDALIAQGVPREEAMSLLAYQARAGTSQEALGELIAKGAALEGAEDLALQSFLDPVLENNWATILESFFGKEVYATLINPPGSTAFFKYVKVGDNFRPIAAGEVREVLRLIRDDNPTLELRGAQQAKFPGGEILTALTKGQFKGTDDAVFQTLAAWAMGKDRQAALAQAVDTLINDNPWMVTDLAPSLTAAEGGFRAVREIDAVVSARAAVVNGLAGIGAQPGTAREALPPDTLAAIRRAQSTYGTFLVDPYFGGRPEFIGAGAPPVGTPTLEQVRARIPGTPFRVPSYSVEEQAARLEEIERGFAKATVSEEVKTRVLPRIKKIKEDIAEQTKAIKQTEKEQVRLRKEVEQAEAKLSEFPGKTFRDKIEDAQARLGQAIRERDRRAAKLASKPKDKQLKSDLKEAEKAVEMLRSRIRMIQNEANRFYDRLTKAEKAYNDAVTAALDYYNDTVLPLQELLWRLERAGKRAEQEPALLEQAARMGPRVRELDEKLARALRNPPQPGPFTRQLDNITVRSYRNLNPKARAELVKHVYGQMLAESTQNPELLFSTADALDNPQLNLLFFEKKATTEALLRLYEGITTAGARNKGVFENLDDQALYDAIRRAQKSLLPAEEPRLGPVYQPRAMELPATEMGPVPRAPEEPVALRPMTEGEMSARKGEVVEVMRRALLQNAMESFVLPAVDEMQQNARAYGWAPDLRASRQDIVVSVEGLNPRDPRFLVAGQDFVDSLSKLQAASRDGKLGENLDALMKAEKLQRALGGDAKAGAEYALLNLSQLLAYPRTVAAGGMLAGGYYLYTTEDGTPIPLPAPNTRYLGMNLATAPFILATTLGAAGAIRLAPGTLGPMTQTAEVGRQVAAQVPDFLRRPLLDTITPGRADEVLFTSQTGRQWARAEFLEAVERNSINISAGGVEFSQQYAQELLRDARLTAEGVKSPALRQYLLRNLDPGRTGIFQYAANATDKAIRQNVFASALKAGMTEDQAGQLARASMLDYGKSRVTSNPAFNLNKYIMFLAFREAMMRETLEALTRDPASFNRLLLAHRDLSKAMDEEMQADYQRVRIPFPSSFIFDNSASARVYGPVTPSVEMYSDAVQFAAWALRAGAADAPPGEVARAIADENLSPLISMVMADFEAQGGGRGGKLPDEWVAYAVQSSPDKLWPWMKGEFNIKAVTEPEKMTPGRLTAADPTVPGSQKTEYRFESAADQARFLRFLSTLQLLGFQRTTTDYTKLGLTYGVEDFVDPKKRGLPSTFGFATGLETPMGEQSPEAAVMRALGEQERALRAKQPSR
jgi:hypothetical protein